MTPEPTPPAGCDAYDGVIDLVIDGDIDGDARAQFEAHRKTCSHCARVYEELARAKQALASLPMLECPDGVVAAVDAERRVARRTTTTSTTRYAAITLAVAAALVIALMPQEEAPQPTPTEAEQIADVRAALSELRSALADNNTASAALKLRRGLVEPLEKTVSAVGDTKLGEWSATASAMLNAVASTSSSKSG